MKVLFVNPACQDDRITDTDHRVVPIGLYYMAALLLDRGVSAGILNLADPGPARENGQPDPEGVFTSVLASEKPDIIGFSVTNPSRANAMACAAIARETLPRARILFGGPAATFLTDHLMAACPAVDVIVRGEGETTLPDLVRALSQKTDDPDPATLPGLHAIPGLVFRENCKLTDTGPAPLVTDLDSLPHPSRYFTYQHLAMSRGCPGKCTFCGSPKFWGSDAVRFHSPEWLAREIDALAAKGVTHFYISDDTFTMDRDRVIRFCDLMSGRGLTWNAISRVDYMDAELARRMRLAGCIQISFGVESGSDTIKKRLGKPVPNDTAVEAFRVTAAHGIMPRVYFIYGSPGETGATIQESIDLMHRLKPLGAVFYLLTLFPGTHLYRSAVQKGLVSDDIWHQPIEDMPWFELDESLDFPRVKAFGDALRAAFYGRVGDYARGVELADDPDLFPFHADFLSRLAMTFSHGDYAQDKRVENAPAVARALFQRALTYAPDFRAFLGLGMCLQKEKNFQRAVEILDRGLAHYPESKDLHLCKGICRMNQGDFAGAMTCFEPFRDHPDAAHYIHICQQKN